MARSLSTEAYRKLGKEAAKFAKMVTDFERMSSGEFVRHYPDYGYDGTWHIGRHAAELADKLNAYAAENSAREQVTA